MGIEEAIIELLKVNNRVILPSFGAFLVAKDEESDKPYVVFNSFLSFNDGLLIGYLSERNHIDATVAADQVADFVAVIKTALENARFYKFSSLGSFDYEEAGSSRLRFNSDKGEIQANNGAQTKKVEPPKREEPKMEEVKPVEPSPIPVQSVSAPIVVEEKPAIKVEEKVVVINDLPHELDSKIPPHVTVEHSPSDPAGMNLNGSKFELMEDKHTNFSIPAPASADSSPIDSKPISKSVEENIVQNQVEPDIKTKSFSGVLIGLLIASLLILGYVFFIHLPNQRGEEMRKIALEAEAKQQSLVKYQSDSIVSANLRKAATADSLSRLSNLANKKVKLLAYHIIVGGLTDEFSADKLVEKIKSSDFPNVQKIAGNNRFFVSVESFSDISVATQRVEVISKKLKMEASLFTIL